MVRLSAGAHTDTSNYQFHIELFLRQGNWRRPRQVCFNQTATLVEAS